MRDFKITFVIQLIILLGKYHIHKVKRKKSKLNFTNIRDDYYILFIALLYVILLI